MIKVIRRDWLPTSLAALAVWFANFKVKFAQFATDLGFTADDVTAVANDASTVEWLSNAMEAHEANSSALRSFRDQTLYAEKNDPPPAAPTTNLPPAPGSLSSSIIARLVNLAETIERRDGYTQDIGFQLGIVPNAPSPISEADVKPTIEGFEGKENYEFAVVLTNRAKADQSDLQIRLPGQETWQSLKMFTGKSCNAQYVPNPGGQAVKIEVRVQLYKNNQKYGQPSNPVYVWLNP